MFQFDRELTEGEKQALAEYHDIKDTSNMGVKDLDRKGRQGEYIMRSPESDEELAWEEDDNVLGMLIILHQLWLAREDAAIHNFMETDIDPKNISYDEFEHPEMIHVYAPEDAFDINHLTKMRDERTPMPRYRHHSDGVSLKLISKAVADLETRFEKITTGTGFTMPGERLDERVVIVEIPRAAKPMANAAMKLLSHSKVGVLGMHRDENDPESKAIHYYNKLPKIDEQTVMLLTDPMLATGGSMCAAIEEAKKYSPKRIKVVAQLAAPEGIRKVQREHPDVEIHVGVIDSHLNSTNFIIPGLGDAGDRYFGTDDYRFEDQDEYDDDN